jgi:hypothetical protein
MEEQGGDGSVILSGKIARYSSAVSPGREESKIAQDVVPTDWSSSVGCRVKPWENIRAKDSRPVRAV